MALQQQITITGQSTIHSGPLSVPCGKQSININARIKVEYVNASKLRATCFVSFSNASVQYEKTFEFVPDLDGPNFVKQAYEHLKTLPEFADAVDC